MKRYENSAFNSSKYYNIIITEFRLYLSWRIYDFIISCSAEIIKTITPLGYKGTANYFIEEFGLPYTTDELVAAMHEYLYPVYRDEIVLKPGVAEYLNKLRKEGHSLNVLTASPFRMVSPVLKRCGVFDLFEHVWSCEDFNRTKGEPEIYHAAVERVGGKLADSFFFDDNLEARELLPRI